MKEEMSYEMKSEELKNKFLESVKEFPIPNGYILVNDDNDITHEYGGWSNLYFICRNDSQRKTLFGRKYIVDKLASINVYEDNGCGDGSIYDGGSKIGVYNSSLYNYLKQIGKEIGINRIVKNW